MHKYTFAILDTETTGLNYKKGNYQDRIVELAVIKIRNGEVQKEEYFSVLINPERKIPPAASRINKITDDMVADAPLFKDIAEEFLDFLKDVDYLFIHNAKFDLGFLEAETEKCKRKLILPKTVCSVDLSRELYPELKAHNLNAIAKRFNLSIKENECRHRALGDVILTGEILLKFYEDNPLIFTGTIESLHNSQYLS